MDKQKHIILNTKQPNKKTPKKENIKKKKKNLALTRWG